MNIDYNFDDINIENLLKDYEVVQILNERKPSLAYNLITDYIKYHTDDEMICNLLIDKLYIYYLEFNSKISDNKNYFEDSIINGTPYLSNNILKYLLSKDLDFSYVGDDLYNNPCHLATYLALNINDSESMRLLLDKVDDLTDRFFVDCNYDYHTDKCLMNIIAGRFDKALDYFYHPQYDLIDRNYALLNNNELKKHDDGICLDSFDYERDDYFYRILDTLNNSNFDLETKRLFLNNILYSSKIILFNKDNLLLLKDLLSPDEYNNFIDYLSIKSNNDEITIYSFEEDGMHNRIYYEDFDKLNINKNSSVVQKVLKNNNYIWKLN